VKGELFAGLFPNPRGGGNKNPRVLPCFGAARKDGAGFGVFVFRGGRIRGPLGAGGLRCRKRLLRSELAEKTPWANLGGRVHGKQKNPLPGAGGAWCGPEPGDGG